MKKLKKAVNFTSNGLALYFVASVVSSQVLRVGAENPIEYADSHNIALSPEEKERYAILSDIRMVESESLSEKFHCFSQPAYCDWENNEQGIFMPNDYSKYAGQAATIFLRKDDTNATSAFVKRTTGKTLRNPVYTKEMAANYNFRHELSHAYLWETNPKKYDRISPEQREWLADEEAIKHFPEEERKTALKFVFNIRALNLFDTEHDSSLELEDKINERKTEYNGQTKRRSLTAFINWAVTCLNKSGWDDGKPVAITDDVNNCTIPLPSTENEIADRLLQRRHTNFKEAYRDFFSPPAIS